MRFLLLIPLLIFGLAGCGHKNDESDGDPVPSPSSEQAHSNRHGKTRSGSSKNQEANPEAAKLELKDEPFVVSEPYKPWELNQVSADGSPASVVKSFSFSPTQGGRIAFGYESKEERNCSVKADFDYTITIRDLDDTSARASKEVKFRDCIEFPGPAKYAITVNILNSGGCASLTLSFGMLAKSQCN